MPLGGVETSQFLRSEQVVQTVPLRRLPGDTGEGDEMYRTGAILFKVDGQKAEMLSEGKFFRR
jgi:hypothetical protein